MNTFYSKKGFYLALLIFLLWGVISAYWYVCGINGFCAEKTETVMVTQTEQTEQTEQIDEIDEIFKSENIDLIEEDEIVQAATVKKVVKKTFSCTPYLLETIRLGSSNTKNEVAKLEKFLNEFEGENVAVDGTYSSTDKNAVIRMQNKYSNENIALGYGSQTSDGVVGPKTRKAINEQYCLAKSKEQLQIGTQN